MKTVAILIFFLFSFQSQAACRCNCALDDRSLCASSYDIDHPCNSICPGQTPAIGPIGKTACPVTLVYNRDKGIYQWIALCLE